MIISGKHEVAVLSVEEIADISFYIHKLTIGKT